MSPAHASSHAIPATSSSTAPYAAAPGAPAVDVVAAETKAVDAVLKIDDGDTREKFIPVTRFALMDRLTLASAWSPGQAQDVRRFFRYLDYWRQQNYSADLLELEQTYEPFNPDTDLLLTRKFSDAERLVMQKRVIDPDDRDSEPSQLPPHRSQRGRADHDAGDALRPRPPRRFRRLRRVLIYYRGASNGERRAAQHPQVPPQGGIRRADLPAPVPAVQAEALRGARAGRDGPRQDHPRGGREARQEAPRPAARAGQGGQHLHEALQEHPAQRHRDGVSQHPGEIPPDGQGQARRHHQRAASAWAPSAPPARSRSSRRTRSPPRAPCSGSAASPSGRP